MCELVIFSLLNGDIGGKLSFLCGCRLRNYGGGIVFLFDDDFFINEEVKFLGNFLFGDSFIKKDKLFYLWENKVNVIRFNVF